MKKIISLLLLMLLTLSASAEKKSVFLYAGQSNADGREYVQNLPDYMKVGTSPYSPYTHLKWASICGNPSASTFGTRSMATGERYAFCDVVNYWIDQTATQDFYAIKCAYGGTAIAPGVTAEKLPIWYADATWMTTHNAYKGDDITQEAYKNNNSLTKNLTEGFASLVELRRDRHIVADAILVEGGLGQRGLRDSIVKDLSRLGLYGTIVSEWKREQGGIAWHVVIPANTTATLFTPKGKREIGSGSYQFFFF